MPQMRSRKAVCFQHALPRLAVVGDLGDISSKVLFCGAIDLHHLECRPDTARTKTRDDAIVSVMKTDDLIFGPESSGRRRWWRNGFAEHFRDGRVQISQCNTLILFFG